MEIKVEVDKQALAAFDYNMKQLIAMSKKPVQEILQQQARLFAVSAANYTERATPKGSGAAVKKRQTKDINDSIRRIYKPAKWAVGLIAKEMGIKAGKRFEGYIRRRDAGRAQILADKANLSKYYKGREVKIISWDGGSAHTRYIKKRGAAPVRLVFEGPQINRYITRKKKHMGEAKAGWAKAARMIGGNGNPTRGIPAWATKSHHRTRGYGSVKGTGSKSVATVAHYGRYGFSKTTMTGLYRHRANMMTKDIQRMVKHSTREMNSFKRKALKTSKFITKI
jgi:hypothetical protein